MSRTGMREGAVEPDKEQINAVQELINVPLIGDTIGLIIGLFPPFFLALYLIPFEPEDQLQKLKANLLMSFSMFVWTLFLYLVLRIKITLPLIPIPLFVIGILGTIYQLVRYFTL
ncbi:MAG: hypothetical protein ACJ72Z_00140 [Pyrinomonadaceae bacterium]